MHESGRTPFGGARHRQRGAKGADTDTMRLVWRVLCRISVAVLFLAPFAAVVAAPPAAAGETLSSERCLALFNERDGDWRNVRYFPTLKEPGKVCFREGCRYQSYIALYEATRDTQYLDRLIHRFDAFLQVRDDVTGRQDTARKRPMKSWGLQSRRLSGYHARLDLACHVYAQIAGFVRLVRGDQALVETYGHKADVYAAAIRESLADLEADWRDGPGEGEGYYFEIARGEPGSYEKQCMAGRTWLELGLATGDAPALDRASKVATLFRRRLSLADGAYDWEYRLVLEPAQRERSARFNHAAASVEFARACHENDIVFTEEDMERFCATFL